MYRAGWWVSSAPSNEGTLVLGETTDAELVMLDAEELEESATREFIADHPGVAVMLFGSRATPHVAARLGAAGLVPDPFESAGALGVTYVAPDGMLTTWERVLVLPLQAGTMARDELMGVRRADGSEVWVRTNIAPEAGTDPLRHLVATFTDASARTLAEREAHEEALTIRTILEAVTNPIIMIDSVGTILQANPSAHTTFGWSVPELLGQNVTVLMPESDWAAHPRYMRHYLATGEASSAGGTVVGGTGETVAVTRSGEPIPVSLRIVEVPVEAGEERRFVGVFHDISAARAAARDFEAIARDLRRAGEIAHLGFWKWDKGTQLISVSDEVMRLLDLEPGEIDQEAMSLADWLNYSGREAEVGGVSPLTLGEELDEEIRIVTLKGSERLLRRQARPVRDGDGNLLAVEGTILDITERRRLTMQLVQAQRLEAIGQLAAGVAHEINTPIQYVGYNVSFLGDAATRLVALQQTCRELLEAAAAGEDPQDLLRRAGSAAEETGLDFLTAELPKAIEQTLEGVERVTTIVSAMKEFSHPGAADKQLMDLNDAIRSTVELTRNEWKYSAEVVCNLAANLQLILAFPDRIKQALLNLVINAAQAIEDVSGDAMGTITITTRNVWQNVEVDIDDDGCGIPADQRHRIFDLFYTTKAAGRGTGQGLAIVHAVVVGEHGGTIAVAGNPGGGTSFRLRLPIAGSEPRTREAA